MKFRFYREIKNKLFMLLIIASAIFILLPLFLIIRYVIVQGAGALSLSFFTELPKPVGEVGGGMKHAILGTLYVVMIGALIAIPIGITCGVYLSEFKKVSFQKLLK